MAPSNSTRGRAPKTAPGPLQRPRTAARPVGYMLPIHTECSLWRVGRELNDVRASDRPLRCYVMGGKDAARLLPALDRLASCLGSTAAGLPPLRFREAAAGRLPASFYAFWPASAAHRLASFFFFFFFFLSFFFVFVFVFVFAFFSLCSPVSLLPALLSPRPLPLTTHTPADW